MILNGGSVMIHVNKKPDEPRLIIINRRKRAVILDIHHLIDGCTYAIEN